MSVDQLVARAISCEAEVDNHKLRTGELNESDWEKIAMAATVLNRTPLLINDSAESTVTQMKAKLRKVKNLGLVVIDYIQLMHSGRKNDSNRVTEVSEISRSLKLMAKELNVPVMVCSQLSRGPEGRQDKRPMLSDLRESGAIEQDADMVMFVYRDDYYDPESEERNVCEVIVAKNRHGSTNTVKLQFAGEYTKFSTLETRHHEDDVW